MRYGKEVFWGSLALILFALIVLDGQFFALLSWLSRMV